MGAEIIPTAFRVQQNLKIDLLINKRIKKGHDVRYAEQLTVAGTSIVLSES